MAQSETEVLHADAVRAGAFLSHPAAGVLASFRQGQLKVEVRFQDGSLWVTMQRGEDGGLALRMPTFSPDCECRVIAERGALPAVECTGEVGKVRLDLGADAFGLEQIRATLSFTPSRDIEFGSLPRDLVPFGRGGDPASAKVQVEAAQRKMNTGLVYFTLEDPDIGKVLYVQNLSALNDYYNTTGSKPESAVSGNPLELGYAPPLNAETGKARLPSGKSFTLYDSIVCIRGYPQESEDDSAWQFLDMLGAVYPWLSPPETTFRDWTARAEATVDDLMHAPEAAVEHYGQRYFHPYTASEYPDVMVQLSIASAMEEWG